MRPLGFHSLKIWLRGQRAMRSTDKARVREKDDERGRGEREAKQRETERKKLMTFRNKP